MWIGFTSSALSLSNRKTISHVSSFSIQSYMENKSYTQLEMIMIMPLSNSAYPGKSCTERFALLHLEKMGGSTNNRLGKKQITLQVTAFLSMATLFGDVRCILRHIIKHVTRKRNQNLKKVIAEFNSTLRTSRISHKDEPWTYITCTWSSLFCNSSRLYHFLISKQRVLSERVWRG
jgi:hypothetical protein